MFEESEVSGPDICNKTWYPKAVDYVNTDKPWYIVDATDKILWRLASIIAIYIRGKSLATYIPSVDIGAFVIVVNAEKVAVSGKRRTEKLYKRHSGRPGGMEVETFAQLQQRILERIIEHAVSGMLPNGRLGRKLFTHLKVYKGTEYRSSAPVPEAHRFADNGQKNTKAQIGGAENIGWYITSISYCLMVPRFKFI